MKYKFSAPMPYNKKDIDKILDINATIEKSKITSLYASLPSNCELFTGFEQSRNLNFDKQNWDYWKYLIEHTLSQNCDFIYLLNSPKPFNIGSSYFALRLEKLEKLLNQLKILGVNKLRVASGVLMFFINKHYPDFNILASTSLEYKTIQEYKNFIDFHPELKQIVPCHDLNKNFQILSFVKKKYPNIEIELMVNEGCLRGCPNRNMHEMTDYNIEGNITGTYCTSFCTSQFGNYPFQSFVMGSHIYPYEIEEYGKIGINNFKFVGRDGYRDNFQYFIKSFTDYLKGIDNINNIKNTSLNYISSHYARSKLLEQLMIKDYKKYLPNIKYFKKNGHLCASRCGTECRYCYKCAEKIQKIFENKIKQNEKKPHYVPACKIN